MMSYIKDRNKDTKDQFRKEQDYYRDVKNKRAKEAQNRANQQILPKFRRWYKSQGNCDIIVSSSSDVKTLKNAIYDENLDPNQDKIFFNHFFVDETILCEEVEYTWTEVVLSSKTVKMGGGISGYSVNGSSISPNYSDTSSETEYYVERENRSSNAYSQLIVKAVKKGSASTVIEKEKEFAKNYGSYVKATQYKNNPKNEFTITAAKSKAYNILFFVGISLIPIICFLMQIAFNDVKGVWLENIFFLNYYLRFSKIAEIDIVIWAIFIILFCIEITLIVLRHIFKSSKIKWKDTKRLRFFTISSILVLISFMVSSLVEYSFIDNSFAENFIPYYICANIKIIGFIIAVIYIGIGIYHLCKNPNYAKTKQELIEIKDFIDSGKFQTSKELEAEIHAFTIKKLFDND